jgi:hypothetical protein
VQSGTNFYLNGGQGGAVNFTMDGINAQNNLLSGSFYLYSNVVSVDRAEEVRGVTSPADAEYGRGSGQVQMVTRGGGNEFHGAAFIEVRNGAFNANTFINNALGKDANGHEIAKRDQLKQNNYGVRLGGPVKRNKTFLMGSMSASKQLEDPLGRDRVQLFRPASGGGSDARSSGYTIREFMRRIRERENQRPDEVSKLLVRKAEIDRELVSAGRGDRQDWRFGGTPGYDPRQGART